MEEKQLIDDFHFLNNQALDFYEAVSPVLKGNLSAAIRASIRFKLSDACNTGDYLADLVKKRCSNGEQFDIVGLVYEEALEMLIQDLEKSEFDSDGMELVYNEISIYPNFMATDFTYKPEKIDEFEKKLLEQKENLELSATSIEVLKRLNIDFR